MTASNPLAEEPRVGAWAPPVSAGRHITDGESGSAPGPKILGARPAPDGGADGKKNSEPFFVPAQDTRLLSLFDIPELLRDDSWFATLSVPGQNLFSNWMDGLEPAADLCHISASAEVRRFGRHL